MPLVEANLDGTMIAPDCEDADTWTWRVGMQRFRVDDVFLDELEVSNACVAACVDDGACDAPPTGEDWPAWEAPENADYAAAVPVALAEQLCAWRGGRLPTLLELIRASHGDVRHVAKPELYDSVVDCLLSPDGFSPECHALHDHFDRGGRPVGNAPADPVGSLPADRGPHGHHDLFGGRGEWTASYYIGGGNPACDHARDAPDPGSFGPEEHIGDPTFRAYFVGGRHVWSLTQYELWPLNPLGINGAAPEVIGNGYRCAYDPVYVEEESD
jgi:formylglycine-generating enzyme required for sulfatase activity